MQYECEYCERETDTAHTVTLYHEDGTEDRLQLLCDDCYSEWLHALKG